MSDFEDRLSSALRSAGDHAPEATGLAPAAHRRADVRRRRTAFTWVAAVAAVAAVVGGAALLGDRDGGSTRTPVADATSPTPATSPSVRVESWRDIGIVVPQEWGHGSPGDWCADGGDLDHPVVERPGGASEDILCSPEQGYGAQFMDGALADLIYEPGHIWQYEKGEVAVYPDGAWLGYERGSGDNLVLVVAPDRKTVEQVLDSSAVLGPTDPDGNGCLPKAVSEPGSVPSGQVRLCRYGLDGWLEQSEVLTGQDAVDAVAALESAPAKGDRMCTMALTGPTIQVTGSDVQGQVTLEACQGFSWDGTDHDLTSDVLFWVLSPGWSGGVEGDVPMPTELRQ